jgi:TonB-linked SusC/RagA family outer membrane protein
MKKVILKSILLLLLCGTSSLFAQTRQVSGVVSDNLGEALPGVSVTIKGTTKGIVTSVDGKYILQVSSGNNVLVFSYIGYEPQDLRVGNQSVMNITLNESTENLSEVVIVGYGTQKKSQLTGAISQVTAKEIQELPITSAGQALQGRAAGVDVTQAGSKPGSSPQIRIRGRRSFNATNNPLFVVDGIPIAGGIEDINPNDITSMEVLKDASATAIYGSRGSNGVILVTTKRGKAGKTIVSIDTWTGVSQELGQIGVFDGPAFAEYKRESRRATGNYPNGPATAEADANLFTDPIEAEGIALGRTTDYIGGLLRTGSVQSHQLGISGGSEKTTFNISGGFFKDIGIVKNQDFSRYTFRINLDHKINDKLRIGTSTLAVYSVRNGENFNPLGGALQENPLGKPYDDEGNLIFLPTNDGLRTNPFAEIVPGAQVDETKRYRIFNSMYGEWKIIDGLTYRMNFGPDITSQRRGRFTGSQTNARRGGGPNASVNNEFRLNYTLENILNYTKRIGTSSNLGVTLLQSVQRDNLERSNINVQGVPAETQLFYRLGDASQVTGVNTSLEEWALLSYMGRVNYDFKEKYLLTLTLRTDGSSRFGNNTKFGYFPSAAVGWNIDREDFISSATWIDNLKIRASYGSIGNQAIDPYQTQALLGRTVYAWDNSPAFGYQPNTIGNPNLRWESSATANVGLDFSLFKGRVYGSAEYYVTNTTNLLAPQPLPGSTGFDGFITNVGQTRNSGVELTFSTVNVDKSNFTWTTDWVFNKNREEIVELANGKEDDIAAGRFIGEPLSVFFDLKKLGIWQLDEADEAARYQSVPGEIKVEDLNNDGKINADDRQILGSAVPNFVLGLTNRFSYKNLDVSVFAFARVGQTIASAFHDNFNSLFGRYNNLDVDYWTPTNPTNEFPRPNQNQERPKFNSSMRYFDGSFLKIRNINVGYNFSPSVAEKLKMESLRVFSSIQQPLIIASYRSKYKGIDPETQIDSEQGVEGGVVNANISPAAMNITFGINAKF